MHRRMSDPALEAQMPEKIKSTLWAVPPFGLALWFGYEITLQMTGSVGTAIERMIVAVVLWLICALVWKAVCAVARILTQVLHAPSDGRRKPHRVTAPTTHATWPESSTREARQADPGRR